MTDFAHAGGIPKLGLIGFRLDENSSFRRGAAEAPPIIREALASDASNLWTENGIDLSSGSLISDEGDLAPVAGEESFSRIEAAVRSLLERQLRPIALGGDHSITYPVVRAIAGTWSGLTILDFDAHPDLYEEFQGSRYSHACPFARIMDERLARRLIQVGIRTLNRHQRRQAEKFGVEVIEMKDWRGLLPTLDPPVYLSFDLDVLDPAFAPGVSHREPGGFSVRQVLSAIQSIRADIVGADLVEFNPRMDTTNVTATVCAKLLKEIAAKMLETA